MSGQESVMPETEESEEKMLQNLRTVDPSISKEEKEDLVLLPDLHVTAVMLLDHKVELRPLPISVCKKLSRKISPVATHFETVQREGGDAGDPELDITTIDTLLDCVADILAPFYKFPSSLSKERLEDDLSPEELVDFLKLQLVLNRENNFLLFNLRGIIRAVDLVGQPDPSLDKQPSTPPTANNGELGSESSSTTTPTDS